jgi:predicted nucleic acid-binding protein
LARLVIDASVAAAWCFPDEETDYTNGVLQTLSGSVEPIAPSLWAYEIRNTLLMGVKRQRITKDSGQKLLIFLNALNVALLHPASYDVVFGLAESNGLTIYDAAYLDLAIRENAPLASLDKALRNAAIQCGVALFEVPSDEERPA